jgi:hypothetical protein
MVCLLIFSSSKSVGFEDSLSKFGSKYLLPMVLNKSYENKDLYSTSTPDAFLADVCLKIAPISFEYPLDFSSLTSSVS